MDIKLSVEEKKEKRAKYMREYRQRIVYKQWLLLNRESELEKKKKYYRTKKGYRKNRISKLKSRGMFCEDWELLMDEVQACSHCELCGIRFTISRIHCNTTRCVDHCHITGMFRNIVCHSCNIRLPRQKKYKNDILTPNDLND